MELTINRLIELLDQNKYLCLKDLEVFLTNKKNYFTKEELDYIKENKTKILKTHNREFLNKLQFCDSTTKRVK